jgi:hypothetical protein
MGPFVQEFMIATGLPNHMTGEVSCRNQKEDDCGHISIQSSLSSWVPYVQEFMIATGLPNHIMGEGEVLLDPKRRRS